MNHAPRRTPVALVLVAPAAPAARAAGRAVAEGLRANGFLVRLDEPREGLLPPHRGVDLVVVGAPIQALCMAHLDPRSAGSQLLHEWLLGNWVQDGGGRPAATFDTAVSGGMPSATGASVRAAQLLGWRHFSLLDRPVSFAVDGWGGPLRAGEVDRARRWGRSLAVLARSGGTPAGRPLTGQREARLPGAH